MNSQPTLPVADESSSKAPHRLKLCPKCGRNNLEEAYFCTSCHQILIHRCPNCWHEQRSGGRCEKCGTDFALYWEHAFERAVERENRIWWDTFKSVALSVASFALWPILSLRGLLRYLLARLLVQTVSNR